MPSETVTPASDGSPPDFSASRVLAQGTPMVRRYTQGLPVTRVALEPTRRDALKAELLRGLDPGEPLSPETRRRACALSRRPDPEVRLHQDEASRRNVDMLGSAALTIGPHILLGTDAAERRSERLVAHEVAHTIQQSPGSRNSGDRSPIASLEVQADQYADAFVRHEGPHRHVDTQRHVELASTPPGIAQKVVWKHLQELPGNLLLIIDVDDGDFVGGCIRKIVPHAGVKLIQKSPHLQLFNAHIGYTTNAVGEYCAFFYESVTGICETKCFPTKEALERATQEILDWLMDLLETVLKALAVAVLLVGAAVLAYLIAQALVAGLVALLALAAP